MQIQHMPLSGIQVHEKNPKGHDLEAIKASIRRQGFRVPLILDERTNKLAAGHGRLAALKEMQVAGEPVPAGIREEKVDGEWFAPVVCGMSSSNDADAEAFLVADNRLVELGGWDEAALSAILDDLRAQDGGLLGTGFEMAELERMTASAEKDVVRGPTVDEYATSFVAGAIKQIQLYFPGEEFDAVLARLQAVMATNNIDSHTAAFKFLLEHYEASVGNSNAS